MSGPTVGSLFSGYGGAELGLQEIWPETRTAWVSDIESGPRKVLAHRHPDAPNLGDITAVDWTRVEPVDIITGGSPCQDLSHAGKRAGMKAGTRSGLWASMCDAIETLRPGMVIWENVRGAYSAAADSNVEPCPLCVGDEPGTVLRALGRVLGDLAEIRYDAIWTGLRAADVGACHGRFRVFVIAWPTDAEREPGHQWRVTTPRQTPRGWSSADDSGRGGEPALTGDLLPTVTTQPETGNGHARNLGKEIKSLPTTRSTRGGSTTEIFDLLPTPQAHDEKGGKTPEQVATMRAGGAGVKNLNEFVVNDLLPTPACNDMGKAYTPDQWDEWTATMQAKHGNGNGHGKSLEIEAARLDGFGQYAPAIARWETVLGRPAPAPTEPTGRNGAARLSANFCEFMMGLPDGWVTDVPGVSRNEALKLCGNGIVPAQLAEAVRWCLEMRESTKDVTP